jgi:Na+-driven multidrug efflux pump
MAATARIVVIDGMFVVGHGVGREGLAAVNIAAPLFMIFTGLG